MKRSRITSLRWNVCWGIFAGFDDLRSFLLLSAWRFHSIFKRCSLLLPWHLFTSPKCVRIALKRLICTATRISFSFPTTTIPKKQSFYFFHIFSLLITLKLVQTIYALRLDFSCVHFKSMINIWWLQIYFKAFEFNFISALISSEVNVSLTWNIRCFLFFDDLTGRKEREKKWILWISGLIKTFANEFKGSQNKKLSSDSLILTWFLIINLGFYDYANIY